MMLICIFYMFCILVFGFSKLILSNSLGAINHIQIYDSQVNLTIWMQMRYSLFKQSSRYQTMCALRIADQHNQDQLNINIHYDLKILKLEYDIQQQIREFQELDMQGQLFEWVDVSIQRHICFDSIINHKITINFICYNKPFNATLFTFATSLVQILVYDQLELSNEQIQIQKLSSLKYRILPLNIFKNNLEIQFYVKFYFHPYEKRTFFIHYLFEGIELNFQYLDKFIEVALINNQNEQKNKNQTSYILYEQWLYFLISHIDFNVSIYFIVNNQIQELQISLDECREFFPFEKVHYLFYSELFLISTNSIRYDSILISNYVRNRDIYNFCFSDCQICQDFTCQDDPSIQKQQFFISQEIQSSNYYKNYNKHHVCKEPIKFEQNECTEWPKYYGEYCFNCQYLQSQIVKRAEMIDFILDLNYKYYFYNINNTNEMNQELVGMVYEQDLNIFIYKIKDIYLIYKSFERYYCEDNYFFNRTKCVKLQTKCQLQKEECMLCLQKYSLANQQCVRCPKYCLYCVIRNKKIHCLLFLDNYYQDEIGRIKECKLNQKKIICQKRDEITQFLTSIGYEVCYMRNEFYDLQNKKCTYIDFDLTYNYLLNYTKQLNVYKQKLEIQDMLLFSKTAIDDGHSQIKYMILHQQTNKFYELANQLKDKTTYLSSQQHFEQLSMLNQTKDNIDSGILVFKDILIFLGEIIIIKYKHQEYSNLTLLYESQDLKFSFVQFDVLIIENEPLSKRNISIVASNDLNKNVSYILNATFHCDIVYLHSKCVSFFLIADEVILHNLNYQSYYDTSCTQKNLFNLFALKIYISNVILQNTKLGLLFKFQNFNFIRIQNIFIKESIISYFLSAAVFDNRNSVMEIHSIFVYKSQLKSFIVIFNVQLIIIHQIYLKDNILYENIITFIEKVHYIDISYIIVQNVTMLQSNFIIRGLSSQYYIGDKIRIANISFENTQIQESAVFFFENITSIIISEICLRNVKFLDSNFIFTNNFKFFQMKQANFLNISQFNSYIMSVKGDYISIIDYYINTLNSFLESALFFFQIKKISIYNLQIQNALINNSNIITLMGSIVELVSINIQNIYVPNQVDFIFQVLQLNSKIKSKVSTIYIRNIFFNNLTFDNSQLFLVETNDYLKINNYATRNLHIVNLNQTELILFQSGHLSKFEQIKFQNIFISSQIEFYCLLRLTKYILITFDGLKLIDIYSIFKQRNVFMQLESFRLMIKNSKFINIHNIQSLQVKSQQVYFQYFEWLNSTSQTFISCETQQIFQNYRTVRLFHFIVKNIKGQFVNIESNFTVYAIFSNVTIDNYQNSEYLIKVISGFMKLSSLTFNNIKIMNQQNDNSEQKYQQIFLIQQMLKIKINRIYIFNSQMQFCQINQTNIIIFSNIFIKQSEKTAFQIIQASKQILVANVTILNNHKMYDGVFQFGLDKKCQLLMNGIRLINIVASEPIFKFNSALIQSRIKLHHIILINVSSQHSIIYSDMSLDMIDSYIIEGQSRVLFSAISSNLFVSQMLVTNINQLCQLSQSQSITIYKSEIVDSKIVFNELTLTLNKSTILGNFQNQTHQIKMFLSLDNGQSVYRQKHIEDKLYQFQFSKENKYLYLPSGQDVQKYQYLNYKTNLYNRLYDSVSFVSKFQYQEVLCNLTQQLDNNLVSAQSLIIIPGVNILHNLIVILSPYSKEKHIQLDLICNQNNQIITYRTLVKTLNCQLGEYLYNDQCQQCNIEQKLYSVGYNQLHCLYMDENKIQNLKIGQIKLYPQYWRFSAANKYIEYCQTLNCVGGWIAGDGSCKIGYIGAICSECDINNIRGYGNYGKIENQCQLCYFDQTIYLKILCLIIYQLIIIYVNFQTNKSQSQQFLFIRIAKRQFTEILLRQNTNQAAIIIKLYYNYLFTLYLLQDFIQFGYFVSFSFNLVCNPNFIAAPQFDCLIHKQIPLPVQYSQVLYKILMPIVIFNIFIIIYITLIKVRQSKYNIFIVVVCLITIFQQNQLIIVQSLIRLSQKVKYSNIYWTLEYKASQFYSSLHQQYLIKLILPLIIIFVVINLIFFYWIKIINSRIINNLKLSLFFYKQYHNIFYYWEFVRISFIYAFMIAIYHEGWSIYIAFITLIFQLINWSYRPFGLNNLNQIDQIIVFFSIFSYLAISVIYQVDYFNSQLILIISNITLIKFVIKYFIHGFNCQYRKVKQLVLLCVTQHAPKLQSFFQLKDNQKTIYYYSVLRNASKKSNNSLSAIYHTQSKSHLCSPFEMELTNLNIKQ